MKKIKKIMLIGAVGCGKTSLNQILHQKAIHYKKTQAIDYSDFVIDTPGEFTENRSFYSALLVTASRCDVVGMVQEADVKRNMYPPGFVSLFPRPVIGIISKVDVVDDCSRSHTFLRRAGVRTIVETSAVTGAGIDSLRDLLCL